MMFNNCVLCYNNAWRGEKREYLRDGIYVKCMHPFNKHEMSDLSSADIIVNSQVSNKLQNE